MVQPLTSYNEGAETKHSHSPAYEVERPHAVELTANGFARMLDGSAHADEAPETVAAEAGKAPLEAEAMIDNDAKPRGRRGPVARD
ncbi:hypothetical protein ASF34_01150 [Methylobacterium sp. Leaf106]|nr:hypothetical protein ASF34_01150 [Methylobacterium sp. Leaf106]